MWQMGPWLSSFDSMLRCAKSSQKRRNGLRVPWNPSVLLTLGSPREQNFPCMKPALICLKKASLSLRPKIRPVVVWEDEPSGWSPRRTFFPEKLWLFSHVRKETHVYHFQTSLWLNTPPQNASTFIIVKEVQRGSDSVWAIAIDLLSPNVSHTYLLSVFMFIRCVPKPFRIKSTIVPRAPATDSQWEGLSLLFRGTW